MQRGVSKGGREKVEEDQRIKARGERIKRDGTRRRDQRMGRRG